MMYTQLSNHLAHSDMLVKIALTAGLIGVVNFAIALLLIVLRLGIISVSQGG